MAPPAPPHRRDDDPHDDDDEDTDEDDEEAEEADEEEADEEAPLPSISFTGIRSAIAAHLLRRRDASGGRELRITRHALQTLRHATEAELADVFRLASTLRDLQRHRTLHLPAFRVAARLRLLHASSPPRG